MSYILRRPMFRKGGSTDDGITSGLRPGYKHGESVEDQFLRTRGLLQKYAPPERGRLNDFLINFGLNMASNPPSGNILQTAATEARGPFKAFQSSRGAADLEQKKLNTAMIGDIMAQRSEEHIAQTEAGGKKGYEVGRKKQIIEETFLKVSDLRKEIKAETDEENLRVLNAKLKGSIGVLTEILGVPVEYAAIIGDADSFDNFVEVAVAEENKRRVNEYKTQNPDATTPDIEESVELVSADSVEAIDLTFTFLKKKYGYQSGGRVGRQLGGGMGAPMGASPMGEGQNVLQGEGAAVQEQSMQNPDSPVQNLSYEELRARLPKEIGDDIVRLLSESEQALIDFANIQTQQDIDAFNQKYQVELVLPAEA